MPEVKIMEDNRKEQLEAIETMLEYNERILKNIPILVKELSGQRLEDTDKFLDSIVKAINWEVQVINLTMDVLNEGKERIEKETINEKIVALSDAINKKEDTQMAEAFEGMVPVLERVGEAAKAVVA